MSEDSHYNQGDSLNGNGGWASYGKLVLSELERLQDELDKVQVRVAIIKEQEIPHLYAAIAAVKLELKQDIVAIQVKAALFGAIAGTVFSAAMVAIMNYLLHN